ncbi:MAG: hypothetical protein NT007_12930 [Candidatus Kapabacteria bacterium]|nr:hypothetical protein [Candidatus Kapabacteria bacterium]
MIKKFLIAIVVVFVAIQVMDYVLHSLILGHIYQQNASIWRPNMMNLMWAMHLSTFIVTVCFVYIYYKLIQNKSAFRGVWYGIVYGIAAGMGMGYSTYCMFPIPYVLAVSWFFGSVIIYTIAGLITALIIKE